MENLPKGCKQYMSAYKLQFYSADLKKSKSAGITILHYIISELFRNLDYTTEVKQLIFVF